MVQGMDAKLPSVPSSSPDVTRETCCDGLLRQGEAVLAALGERRLAREFCRRARTASDREALVTVLLDCLDRRRPR